MTDIIQEKLTRRLETYKLAEKIQFDDSALQSLGEISSEQWDVAQVYAGTAILNALQSQKYQVTAQDIEAVDPTEALRLMLGGKDIWDEIRYIGTQVPNMLPEGVNLRRALGEWDAARNRDSADAVSQGRLPKYAKVDEISYDSSGIMGPEVTIPFRYEPSDDEIRAVAQSVVKFVSEHSGQPQQVEEPSGSIYGATFVVKENNPEKNMFLVDRNYRVTKDFGIGGQGGVIIRPENGCKLDPGTLESYVDSVKASK